MEQTDESKIHYEGINSDQLCEEITETVDFMNFTLPPSL